MKYMLDTNICIFMMKDAPGVLSAFLERRREGVAISSIVLAELAFGVCHSRDYARNRAKLLAFLPLVETLPFDDRAAAEYGILCSALRRAGQPIGQMDMLIAAQALAADLTLATNNAREFARVPKLRVEDWAA